MKMSKLQRKSLRKASSGRKWSSHKKRKYELGRESADTKIGEKEKTEVSVRGNSNKKRLVSIGSVHITNPETGENTQSEIKSVLENPADPHLARRDIITKGAIIETGAGEARVTSRPGQEGSLNAVLIEGKIEETPGEEAEAEEKTESSTESEEDDS